MEKASRSLKRNVFPAMTPNGSPESKLTGTGGGGRPTPDPNSRLPRTLLQGEVTKYIAVEYELPNNKAEPHEIAVDLEGNGWVTQRVGGKLGRFDPTSFTYTEFTP